MKVKYLLISVLAFVLTAFTAWIAFAQGPQRPERWFQPVQPTSLEQSQLWTKEIGTSFSETLSSRQSALLPTTPTVSTAVTEIQDPPNDHVHVRHLMSFFDVDATSSSLTIGLYPPELIGNPSGFWWSLGVYSLSGLQLYDQVPDGMYGWWWNGEWTEYRDSVEVSAPENADVTSVILSTRSDNIIMLKIQVRGSSLSKESNLLFRFWIFVPGSTDWGYYIELIPWAYAWTGKSGWYWSLVDNKSNFPVLRQGVDIVQASVSETDSDMRFAITLANSNPRASDIFQPSYWWAIDTDLNENTGLGGVDKSLFTFWEPITRRWEVFLVHYSLEGIWISWVTYESAIVATDNSIAVTLPRSILQLPNNIRWRAATRSIVRAPCVECPTLRFRSVLNIDTAPDHGWVNTSSEHHTDLWIDRIDVAQTVLAKTKLACSKPTLIRVFAQASGPIDVPATVTITVRDSQGRDLGAVPVEPTAVLALAGDRNPGSQENSFNFLVAQPVTCPRGIETVTISARVDALQGWIDTNPNNNEQEERVIFEYVPPVTVGWVPITITIDGLSFGGQWTIQAEQFFRSIYPGQANFIAMPETEPIVFQANPDGGYSMKGVLGELKSRWRAAASEGVVMPDRLFGALPFGTKGVIGEADAKWIHRGEGRVAVGITEGNQYTLAHELLHLLDSHGLLHARWKDDDRNCYDHPTCILGVCFGTDYPNDTGHLDFAGIDVISRAWSYLSPEMYYDVMTYCSPRWISAYNYEKLFFGFEDYGSQRVTSRVGVSDQSVPVMLVSGVVYSASQTAEFFPIYPLGPDAEPDVDEGGEYCFEQRADGGVILDRRCFAILFSDYEVLTPTNEAYFVRSLPQLADTKALVLTYKGKELGRVSTSTAAPSVRVIRPNGDETLPAQGTYTVSWEASDPDGDTLAFALYYSRDGGTTWTPAAFDIRGTEYSLHLPLYRGTTQARLKIIASDGFLWSDDISDADFTVAPKAPEVIISAPSNNAVIAPGYGILFQGWARDLEDGVIPAVTWTSDVDGYLGSGEWIVVSDLRPGNHRITLTATDSQGEVGSASINLFVGHRLYLPLMLRNR